MSVSVKDYCLIATLVLLSLAEANAQRPTFPHQPRLTSYTISGAAPAVGGTSIYTAAAKRSDGTTEAIDPASAQWISSNASIADWSSPGVLKASTAGTLTVSSVYGGISTSQRITIVDAPAAPLGDARFVATDGSDAGLGTSASPWQTLQYAVAQLKAGDTLYIRGGTYTGAANVINSDVGTIRGGTSWSTPITIAAYNPGSGPETVILQPPDGAAIALLSAAQQYLIFQDLIIDGIYTTMWAIGDGVYLSGGANHNRFLRLEVKNMLQNGFQVSNNDGNSPFNEIIQCTIHDNGRAPRTNSGYGVYMFTSDNLIEANDIYNNNGYGLHLYNNGGPLDVARNVVRKNKIHDNHNRAGDPIGESGNSNAGLLFAWGDSNVAYDNLIYRNGGGIQVYVNSTNARIYNNTIYDNTALPATATPGLWFQYCAGAIAENNIVFANALAMADYSGCATLSNNLTVDPVFGNAAGGDFHLQTTSPAIDAGVAVPEVTDDFEGTPRPQANAPAIGAYEYHVEAPTSW